MIADAETSLVGWWLHYQFLISLDDLRDGIVLYDNTRIH